MPTTPTVPSTSTTSSTAPLFVSQPGDGVPVVVDYSPTSSDVAALLFMLQADGVRVDAITIPRTGESHCEQAVANTLSLLLLVERTGIPVACGSSEPIAGSNQWPNAWREAADELSGLVLPEGGRESPLSGPELLAAAVMGASEPVKLLTLGPLTNVAEALALEPAFVTNVESIYIMGGAVEAAGNVFANDFAEWNVWIDPAAAQVVFDSGAPIVLIPLDATNAVPVTRAWMGLLEDNRTTPAASAVFDLFAGSPGVLDGGFYFWDELAAAVLLDHSYVTLEEMPLAVVQRGADEGRTKRVADGAQVRVAVAADAARFQRDLLSILSGGVAAEVEPADPLLVAYFTELEAVIEKSDRRIREVFDEEGLLTVIFEPDSVSIEEVRAAARALFTPAIEVIGDELAESTALDVPADAQSLHEAYLTAAGALFSLMVEALRTIDAMSAEDLVAVLESGFDSALDGLFKACGDLQGLAFERGIDADLFCSG